MSAQRFHTLRLMTESGGYSPRESSTLTLTLNQAGREVSAQTVLTTIGWREDG